MIKYVLTCKEGIIEFISSEEREYFVKNNNIQEYTFTDTEEDITVVIDPFDKAKKSIQNAIDFGKSLSVAFLAENVVLGIVSAGMVDRAREILDSAFRAIETGSLLEAIEKLKAIPESSKDPIFITNERLLKYINAMEEYLTIPFTNNL